MAADWLAVPFTSRGYLWVTDHRDEVQENQEAGTLKKWTICLGAELYYAALFVAGLAETAVRAFFATLTHLIFAIVPISLREKIPKAENVRIDQILISLLNTSSYVAAETTLASLSSLFVNFCVTSVKKREALDAQMRLAATVSENTIHTCLDKRDKIFSWYTIANSLTYGVTTTAYLHLTAFRDGKRNDSLLVTLGRRITAEIGYTALAIVGVVEIVARAALALIGHLLLSFTTESCREFIKEKKIRGILTGCIDPLAVTTCLSAANLVNNIWSSSLDKQSNLSEQLKQDKKFFWQYKEMFTPTTEYQILSFAKGNRIILSLRV
jgi:hypothetical protein